jgi:predicted choloylglycine hydrolase
LAFVVVFICAAIASKDHIRTLSSLRRVPGTNAYVMDYYLDYHLDDIRSHGIDVENIEDSFIDALFPDLIAAVAVRIKGTFVSHSISVLPDGAHRCSTASLRTSGGKVIFGRNFDWHHDACLIVRVHGKDSISSVAVIDIAYLNLNRPDLDATNLIQRIPLLFAPYYVMDGMNQYGVAVSDMAVKGAQAPYDASKPNILHSTAMRAILDEAKSVDEAIAILEEFNVRFSDVTCHLMIADASGKSVIVEYIAGEMRITGPDENWQVCTNHEVWGRSEADRDEICTRYRNASAQLENLGESADASDMMTIMESVSSESVTMWTSVYDLSAREFSVAYRRKFANAYHDQLRMAD